MGYKIRKFDGSFNETNNMDGVFDESRNTLNGRGDNDISRFSLNGRGDNDISPYSLHGVGAVINDPNYDFYNPKARGLNDVVKVVRKAVPAFNSASAIISLPVDTFFRAYKKNSDVPPQYSATHRKCAVMTNGTIVNYLLPNYAVHDAYLAAGKDAYLAGLSGEPTTDAETTYSTTTLAGVGAAAMVAGLAAGWFLFKKK